MTRRQFSFAAALAAPWTRESEAAAQAAAGAQTTAAPAHGILYKPQNAFAADFIPLYAKGRYYLFYLHDWRDTANHGRGVPWYLISTSDFVNFTEHGEVLPRKPERETWVFTGSAFQAQDGKYHIYYVGHNSDLKKEGQPEEVILHATSDDVVTWTRVAGDIFQSPGGKYEIDDWRDPYVFYNAEAKEYWMVFAARITSGPKRRRGVSALAASRDLKKWEIRDPLYAPGLYHTHECPDLFRMGDWWYLLFSEFSDASKTRYRMARSLSGPWLTPSDDTFDGRGYYAAKTASDGQRRFIFGWLATRGDSKGFGDDKSWNWGGHLVVHELIQQPDGTLRSRIPDTVDRAFDQPAPPPRFATGVGEWSVDGDAVRVSAPGRFASAVAAGLMPEECRIEASVTLEPGTRAAGIILRASDDQDAGYFVRIDGVRNSLTYDMWPRRGDVPFMQELERPLKIEAGRPVDLKIIVDGTSAVVYAGDQVAMSVRMYKHQRGAWGVFAEQGRARFSGLSLATRKMA
jgi:beta-fructofuranosidase